MTLMSLPGLIRQSIETKDASRLRIEVLGSSLRTALDRFALELASFSSSFAGLVVLARSLNPIPSRTRPLNSSAPMVLWLKPWESRSLPGLPRTSNSSLHVIINNAAFPLRDAAFLFAQPELIGSGRVPNCRRTARDHSVLSGAPLSNRLHEKRCYIRMKGPRQI